MRRILVPVMICSANLFAQSTPAQAPGVELDRWRPLRFLIGTWEAKTEGGSAGAVGTGTYIFRLELKNHILARHASTAGCKGSADFDCEHGDILYVYEEAAGQPFRAIYFDNEGHVIHYVISAAGDDKAVFVSDPGQPAPRYRLSYELKSEVMFGKFEILMPGRKEFTTYLEWSGKEK
jgi:hypothetical protein